MDFYKIRIWAFLLISIVVVELNMKTIALLLLLFILNIAHSSEVTFTKEEQHFIKNNPVVTIGSMDTYIPFSFIRNGKKVGFTQDLLDIIAQKSGLTFEVVGGSWPKIYDLFYNAKIDMISEFSLREERRPFTLYTPAYYEIPIGVFTRTDFSDYNGIKSLKNKKIGVVKNSYIIDILNKEKIEFEEFNNADERFLALSEGTIDVVITNSMNIYKLEKMMLPNIKLAGRFVHTETKSEDLRFGIRKEKPLLASIINKTYDSIPFSQISELKQNWILKLNQPSLNLTEKEKEWLENNLVTIGIEQAKPYIFFDDKKEECSGLYCDVLKRVIAKTGLNTEYVVGEWTQLLNHFKEGEIDLLPATFYSKEREAFGYFSEEYYKVREYIYVPSENNSIYKFSDLAGKKVAITKEYATIDKIREKFPDIEIVQTNGLAESTAMVLNKEVDAMIDYHLVVENYLRDNSIVGLKDIAQYELEPISVHFFSSIKNPLLRSILQKGLDNISREEMNELLRKWVRTPHEYSNLAYLSKEEQEFMITHQKIRFAIISNRPPFEFIQKDKPVGIAVDYIRQSAKNMGLDIEFVIKKMTNTDAYKMMETSRDSFDTVLMSVKNEERAQRFAYGDTFLSYPLMIITYEKHPYIGSLKDLEHKTIALEKGFLITKRIKKDYPNINVIDVKNTEEALQLVNNEKVDAYVGNLAVANYMNVSGSMKNLKIAAPSGYDNLDYHFIAPKEWPELVSILSKGFSEITPSEHSAIQQKWFSLQTIERVDYTLIWKVVAVLLLVIVWILWWNRRITTERNRTKEALDKLQEAQDTLKQRSSEVQESKNFLESVLDESPDPIMIKNEKGTFLLVNKAVADLYHSTPSAMIGKSDADFEKINDVVQFFNKGIQDILKKGKTEVVYESLYDQESDSNQYYITTKKPFFNEKKERLILIIANNITAIKQLEDEQLKQQQMLQNQSKIAAMGEMLGNISHQWRQPLSVITTQSSAIKVWIEFGHEITNERLLECSESISKQANYLSKTIDDFKNFFISDSTQKQVHDLKNVFYKLEDLVKIPFENNFITCINEIESDIKINLNENILIQSFINIYNNAKDAFAEHKIESDDRYFFVTIKKEQENAVITFKDSAGGINEESLDKIFEPYYTTKHKSLGTGIGLYMTNQIITKHLKGQIVAENESYTYQGKEYKGAKFIITLPLK